MSEVNPTPAAPAESFAELQTDIAAAREIDSGTVPKKRRGRPPGSGKKATPEAAPAAPVMAPDIIDPALMGMLVAFGFDYLAARRGDLWKLTDEERDKLGALSARVATKYAPAFLQKYADEFALASALGMIVFGRVLAEAQLRAQLDATKEAPIPTAPAGWVVDPASA